MTDNYQYTKKYQDGEREAIKRLMDKWYWEQAHEKKKLKGGEKDADN